MANQLSKSQSSLSPQADRSEQARESAEANAVLVQPVSLSSESSISATDEEATVPGVGSHVQNVWESAIKNIIGEPDGYAEVAVLIIKWHEDLDELKCGEEVEKLVALFKASFGFETEVLNLGNSKPNCQVQLSYGIQKFVYDHDGPNHLMIIYYTGHCSWHEERRTLELHANDWSDGNTIKNPTRASWGPAESGLINGPHSDVLVIFDACYASNVQKSVTNGGRIYQLIAASGFDQPTAGPGKYSFTTALIKSLKELLHEYGDVPFTAEDLAERVNRQQERKDNPCFVHRRLKRLRDPCVRLAPLPSKAERAVRKQSFNRDSYRAYFTLRFFLANGDLKDPQIRDFARRIWDACVDTDISARHIDMIPTLEHIQHNRLKVVKSAITAFRRPTSNNATSMPPIIPPGTYINTGASSSAIPFVQLVNPQPAPDSSTPLPTASSVQEQRAATTSQEISRATESLGRHIDFATALLVLLLLVSSEC